MAVTVDATATTPTQFAAVATANNTTLTVGSSATALLVWLDLATAGNPASLTVTWDSGGTNQAMTLLVTQNSTNSTSNLYGLVLPTVGNKTLSASWTGARSGSLTAVSLTGSDVSSVATAFRRATSASPTGTTGTITVAGAAGNLQVVSGSQNTISWTSLTATGSTQRYIDSADVASIGCTAPSAPTLTWTATAGSSVNMALVGVDVSAPDSFLPHLRPRQRPGRGPRPLVPRPVRDYTVAVPTPPQVGSVFVAQQQPDHPLPQFCAGVQGPSPMDPPSVFSTATDESAAIQGPRSWLWTGTQSATSAPPPLTQLVVAQQQPDHPPPTLRAGPQGPNVRPPVTDRVQVVQQQPDHLQSILRAGVQGPNVRPPVSDTVLVRQEQPGHPLPQAVSGVQGPNVRPPVSDIIALRQEHPSHPSSSLRAGVQGPNVAAPPQVSTVLVRQEQPGHPLPILVGGQLAPSAIQPVPPTTNWVIARQEWPDHPRSFLWVGVQGPSVASGIGRIQVVQQQPDHPLSILRGSVPHIRPVVADTILGRQEQPTHPLPALRHWGPSIRPVVADTVLLRQEQPGHLLPTMLGWPSQVPPQPSPGRVLVAREQPGHPLPLLLPGLPPVFVPSAIGAFQSWLLLRQEQPWHPPPTALGWQPGQLTPFVRGRAVRVHQDVRVVFAEPDPEDDDPVQIQPVPQFSVSGPMDMDPYTMDFTEWLGAGDRVSSASVGVLPPGVTVLSQSLSGDGRQHTVWLTGGSVGATYLVTWTVSTQLGRQDQKSAQLLVTQPRA